MKDKIPAEVTAIVPFAKWMSKHPTITNIIIAVELVALFIAALFYDFTTTI